MEDTSNTVTCQDPAGDAAKQTACCQAKIARREGDTYCSTNAAFAQVRRLWLVRLCGFRDAACAGWAGLWCRPPQTTFWGGSRQSPGAMRVRNQIAGQQRRGSTPDRLTHPVVTCPFFFSQLFTDAIAEPTFDANCTAVFAGLRRACCELDAVGEQADAGCKAAFPEVRACCWLCPVALQTRLCSALGLRTLCKWGDAWYNMAGGALRCCPSAAAPSSPAHGCTRLCHVSCLAALWPAYRGPYRACGALSPCEQHPHRAAQAAGAAAAVPVAQAATAVPVAQAAAAAAQAAGAAAAAHQACCQGLLKAGPGCRLQLVRAGGHWAALRCLRLPDPAHGCGTAGQQSGGVTSTNGPQPAASTMHPNPTQQASAFGLAATVTRPAASPLPLLQLPGHCRGRQERRLVPEHVWRGEHNRQLCFHHVYNFSCMVKKMSASRCSSRVSRLLVWRVHGKR